MVIKRLRLRKNWSQEQLAQLSGLGLRTIQRVESSDRMSLESLQALATVFDIDVTELEQEFLMGKTSSEWKKQPLWVSAIFFGSSRIRTDKHEMRKVELFALVAGLVCLGAGVCGVLGILVPESKAINFLFFGSLLFLFAYLMAISVRIGDQYSVWPWVECDSE